LVVLALMGTQSAFFGPSKYGILPEMLRGSDLPRANGLILMTTFLAIIFGTASAGLLGHWLVDETVPLADSAGRLWRGSALLHRDRRGWHVDGVVDSARPAGSARSSFSHVSFGNSS
jgi:MFS family permease